MDRINASSLKHQTQLHHPELTILNVLSEEEFEKKHIPGSINIPLDALDEKAPQMLPDKAADIVVHCSGALCTASARAAAKLEGMGYASVLHFEEGIEGWEQAGFRLEGTEAGPSSYEAMREEVESADRRTRGSLRDKKQPRIPRIKSKDKEKKPAYQG